MSDENVVQLDAFRPHVSGGCMCVQCGHKWVQVSAVGVTVFECPQCHVMKGVSDGFVLPEEFLECRCGGYLFVVTRDGELCANCGILHNTSERPA